MARCCNLRIHSPETISDVNVKRSGPVQLAIHSLHNFVAPKNRFFSFADKQKLTHNFIRRQTTTGEMDDLRLFLFFDSLYHFVANIILPNMKIHMWMVFSDFWLLLHYCECNGKFFEIRIARKRHTINRNIVFNKKYANVNVKKKLVNMLQFIVK